LIVLDDGEYRHVLYEVQPLNSVALKLLNRKMSSVAPIIGASIGLSHSPSLQWDKLSDEQFEQLCYDIIFSHPKFDSSTIRKFSRSRSRDGGRDIEVLDVPRSPGTKARKRIFQCKLTGSKSLGASKVLDIGDMLEQYGAKGFGIMTSTLIDATLYDKLDKICGQRSIEQLNFSALELGRALVMNPVIRKRYFPDS
jgi:hypothetical protein